MSSSIGLVLGGGGVTGGAFHAGALTALADDTGWDPRRATVILGTSIGASTGSLLRADLSAPDQRARLLGEDLSSQGRAVIGDAPQTELDVPDSPKPGLPAAPKLVLAGLLRRRPGLALAGLLPNGSVSADPIERRFDGLFGTGWPEESLWITTVRKSDGKRVVFGRDDVETSVGRAVAASCAVPGYLAPVRIGKHDYVDGGMHSATNADLLTGLGLDAVIVLSPSSVSKPELTPDPTALVAAYQHRLLQGEVTRITERETPVIAVEPSRHDLTLPGSNPFDRSRIPEVVELGAAAMRKALAANPSVTILPVAAS